MKEAIKLIFYWWAKNCGNGWKYLGFGSPGSIVPGEGFSWERKGDGGTWPE